MNSIIDSDGVVRPLGNNPAPVRFSWTPYGSAPEMPLVPRFEWDRLVPEGIGDFDPHVTPVHDQSSLSCCNASATALALEMARSGSGLPYVALSAGDLYWRICGGVDQGSYLEDGLREAVGRGVASVAVCPYLQWQREAAGAAADRARFRAIEAVICPTFDHCYSAVLMGWKLISGVMWYPNFTPDQQGWLPLFGRGMSGGHAVCGYKATRRAGHYGIWHQNSWKNWGLRGQGRCVFPESIYGSAVGGFWAVRAVVTESGDIPAPVNP